jgi:hypothetical protein
MEFTEHALTVQNSFTQSSNKKPSICHVIQLISKYPCDLAEYKMLVGCCKTILHYRYMHILFSRNNNNAIYFLNAVLFMVS